MGGRGEAVDRNFTPGRQHDRGRKIKDFAIGLTYAQSTSVFSSVKWVIVISQKFVLQNE